MTQLALLHGAVAATSEDGTVCIADLAGAPARVLDEHDAEVIALAASPDGRRLATADRLGRLRLWDLASGESRTLDLSQHLAGSLAFSRDGTRVLAAIDDGTVRSWPDDLPADEAALRAWIARALAH
jgi:WD40 repeat protein